MRIGFGYDIHPLIKKRDLILGGVNIPFELGLGGHSDADVLCHAISDALLGSLALGDIGDHFPDTSPEYKGISSLLLLKHVGELICRKNYKIKNIDSTVVAEVPKLSPYKEEMRKNIAAALNIEIDQVSIKATTNEKMDATGKRKAIAAYAAALVDVG